MDNFLTIHEQIETDRKDALPSGRTWTDVRRYRRYYRGLQRGTLNAEQVRLLQGIIGNKFSHNICQRIVTEKANRLEVARFDVKNRAVSEFLVDTWVKNQFPDLFADMAVASLRDSNAFIGLNWVPSSDPKDLYGGRVSLKLERVWDGNEGVFFKFAHDGTVEYAVKEWTDSTGQYRTVYYDDHMVRFKIVDGNWTGYNLPGDPLPRPSQGRGYVAWTKKDGSGLGIPFVHFPNGNDDETYYGVSELDGGVMGFQDQINAIQHDLTAVSVLSGSPRTWSKGFELEKNPDGTKKQPRVGPGAHWHNDNETAEWGILEGGNPAPLIDVLWVKVKSVCQMKDVPFHAITGDWPSGEALFRAEMPAVMDGEKRAKKWGPRSASVMHMSTEIQNTFGKVALDETALITTVFESVERRDDLSRATVAQTVAPFVSKAEVLRLLNYPPDKVTQIIAEMDREADEAVERAQARFAAAGFGDPIPPTRSTSEPETDPEANDE